MAGDMIWRNTGPQTTGTTAHHMRQVPVPCAKCAEPGEVIPLPGLGVEALNQDALPPPQVSSPPGTPPPPYSPSVGSHLPTSNQGGPPIVRSKTRDLPSILVTDTPQ